MRQVPYFPAPYKTSAILEYIQYSQIGFVSHCFFLFDMVVEKGLSHPLSISASVVPGLAAVVLRSPASRGNQYCTTAAEEMRLRQSFFLLSKPPCMIAVTRTPVGIARRNFNITCLIHPECVTIPEAADTQQVSRTLSKYQCNFNFNANQCAPSDRLKTQPRGGRLKSDSGTSIFHETGYADVL